MMLKIMWETLDELIGHRVRGSARRATALALALVLCLGFLPLDASAIPINSDLEDEPQTEEQETTAPSADAEGGSLYTGTQGLDASWQSMQGASSKASGGKAMTNTYILETSTGTRQGGGTADNILYFSVQYTDTSGIQRDAIIMPGEDAQQSSLKTAYNQGNRDKRRADIEKLFGYTTENMLEKKALGNVQTDQLMFTTPVPVQSIDKIQIFGRVTGGASNWSCQGMRVYRVDTLYGLEMYGWYSDWGYIDFAGEVVAQVMMNSGAGTFQWNTSGGVHNIVAPGETGGASGCTLVTAATKDAYESRYNKKTAIGYRHESQTNNAVTFRLDLADIGDAGLETLAGSYEAGSNSKISSLAYCECAALIIRYVDVFDCIREIALPVAINALGQLVDIEGDAAIAGYAQQGDSIAFTAMLPDFASIDSTFLTLGETGAVGAAHLVDVELAKTRTETGSAEVAAANAKTGPLLGIDYSIRPANAVNTLEIAHSGSKLTVSALVKTAAQNAGDARSSWRLKSAGDGYYYVHCSNTTGVMGGGDRTGTSVYVLQKYAGTLTQQWKLEDAGDGYYYLVMRANPTLVLTVQNSSVEVGAKLQVATRNGGANQKFQFVLKSGSAASTSTSTSTGSSASQNVPQMSPVRQKRIETSADDSIRYICFAVYKDVNVGVRVNGATVQYNFSAGDPIQYNAATTTDGISIPIGTRERLALRNAVDGKKTVLRPADRTEQYLVTLCTDGVANAGTVDNLKISFEYVSMRDEEVESPLYDVRDYIKRYYGEWPGNVSDFAYKYGLCDEGVAQMIVPLANVNKFTGVSFKLEGDDEWQYCGLAIYKIEQNGVSSRIAAWEEIKAVNGPYELLSHLRYSREVQTATKEPIFSIGTVYAEGEDRPEPKPDEPDGTGEGGSSGAQPGRLIQGDGETHEFNGKGEETGSKEELDWTKLRNYLTLDDARKGLGFVKQRAEYTVSVKVAKDKVNALDDDCGSKNLFYFRLLFESGSSACTLANQQMVGDAFHTGSTAQFKIYANQDYGEVTAVQIIPDDQDGNGDIYDKLKIDSISVVLEGNKALSPTWEAKSDDEDGLGWVGIDYRDQGEMASNRGAAGRSLSEIATTYPITSKTYSAKLLVCITTGPYESSTTRIEDGSVIPVSLPQLVGSLRLMYHYYDLNGKEHRVEGVDAVDLMNSYAGRSSNNKRTYKVGGETITEDVVLAVSNPAYQFRAGSEDKFFMTVQDISELTDMTFYVQSDVVTNWTITDVSVYLVNGTGYRYLNAKGEYDYAYEKDEDKQKITNWTREENLSTELQMNDSNNGTGAQDIKIYFEPNSIKISDAGRWTPVVTREPNTFNDSLNLYLYPGTGGQAADPDSYDLNCVIRYTEKENGNLMQLTASPLRHGTDGNGRTVLYANGMDATNLLALQSVEVKTAAVRAINAPINYGILQRVRGGVLIETYRLNGIANADSDNPVTMELDSDSTRYGIQRLLLQIDPSMEAAQTLEKEKTDLAVALYFKANAPGAQELRSKYIYLTDMGVDEIKPGHVYELDYVLGDVAEITGINVVAIGSLNAPIRAAYLSNQSKDGEVPQVWGTGERIQPTTKPQRIDFNGTVGFLTLKLKTAEDAGTASSGTTGPVRLAVGYYDEMGYLTTENMMFEDIRPLLEDGAGFGAGTTRTLRLLIPNCSEIRWIELEPWHDTGDTNAEWRLAQVEAKTSLDGHPITRTFDKEKQVIPEGTPLNVMLAEVLVTGSVTHLVTDKKNTSAAEDGKTETTDTTGTTDTNGTNGTTGKTDTTDGADDGMDVFTGGTVPMVIASGDGVKIKTNVSGSTEGYVVTVYAFDPATGATGRASMNPTHRYTDEQLAEIISSAQSVIDAGGAESYQSADGTIKYSADVTRAVAEEAKAAKNVVEYAKVMRKAGGSLDATGDTATFYAPRNYTGEAMHYRIVVASKEASSAAFAVEVTVKSELDLLTEAIAKMETAHTNTLLLKESEAAAQAAKTAEEAKKKAEEAEAAARAAMGSN